MRNISHVAIAQGTSGHKIEMGNINVLTFWSSLISMRLHRHVCIQVVQRAIGLFASLPATLVHALDLFISTSWSLVLLCAGDGYKGIHG